MLTKEKDKKGILVNPVGSTSIRNLIDDFLYKGTSPKDIQTSRSSLKIIASLYFSQNHKAIHVQISYKKKKFMYKYKIASFFFVSKL